MPQGSAQLMHGNQSRQGGPLSQRAEEDLKYSDTAGIMESDTPIRPMTFRVENIPLGTTADQLKKFFYLEDQPRIKVRSIVPAADNYELDVQEYTATISFQAPNSMVPMPRMLDDNISIDNDFHGFTPLNQPQEPIAAE